MSVLGQGSFGVTYLAEDVNLGTRLAIKEYLPGDWAFRDSTQTVRPKSTAASDSFERGRDAFLKEARLLAQVVHPNIVKVRRFFRAHGTAYIAMDFIGGRSLADMLNEDYHSGGYPSFALKQLLVAILGGLAALHDQKIIHRDIKPANIVLEPSGNPMLVDFGAARNFDSTAARGMTVIVTPGYAPIEQYSEDREQGPFTDIYALGALAYRAIIGHPPDAPYKRLNSSSSLLAAVAGSGKYPAPLLEAIDWALAVQPQDRPQSAEVLRAKVLAAPDDLAEGQDGPTKVLGEATRSLETSRQGSASQGGVVIVRADSLRKSGQAVSVGPPRTARAEAGSVDDAAIATTPKRRGKLASVLVGALLFIAAIGGTSHYLTPRLSPGSYPADLTAPTKANIDEAAAVAARAAAGRADVERAAAAAAEQKADKEAADAARAEAAQQAATKAEADREATMKAESERQAAAKAEADRQAAAAEAGRQAAAAARQNATRDAAARAEEQRAAASAPTNKARPAPFDTAIAPADRIRCSAILQRAQLTEEISDDDKSYLREHCH